MEHYMPEIFWHDRQGLLSVDIHPEVKVEKNKQHYRLVTASMQKEIRIWEVIFEKELKAPIDSLAVNFLANIAGHDTTINVVRFSPLTDEKYLASGDCNGKIVVWKETPGQPIPPPASEDMPPNKENWVRQKMFYHDSDVTAITWDPAGRLIASVSTDECLLVHDVHTGRRLVTVRQFNHFPDGLAWDPRGLYLVAMSTDRKMTIVDAAKGTRLRCISSVELPDAKSYKLFHDDQLMSFQRSPAFSPCGELIFAPCAQLEAGSSDLYGLYVFKRSQIESDVPYCFYPTFKPTIVIRVCPRLFKLDNRTTDNRLGLPYRVIWLALTKESVTFFDSQRSKPIAYVENIHYNALTEASWSSDCKTVIVSSLEGYCSFLRITVDVWGEFLDCEPERPPSPQLIKRPKKRAAPKAEKKTPIAKKSKELKEGEQSATPRTPKSKLTPLRKPTNTIDKFFMKVGSTPRAAQQGDGCRKALAMTPTGPTQQEPGPNDLQTTNTLQDVEMAEMNDSAMDKKPATMEPGSTSDTKLKKRVALITLE